MAYERINWENAPSSETPLNADNLNRMDKALEDANAALEELQSSVKDASDKYDLVNARMDTIVAVPAGSTTDNAELLDIRVGADGVTYTTAGKAVRDQLNAIDSNFTQLKDALTDIETDFNELFIPYEWLNGYYALGSGAFTAQTGTVTYHSTNKIDGTVIPADTEFINSGYLYLSDSFFAVWDGDTYRGYLMNNVWHNPSGSVPSAPPVFTKYAIVLHNVSNYAGFGRRKYAYPSETTPGVDANYKSSLLVETVNYNNNDIASVSNATGYGYKATKRIFVKTIKPYYESGLTVYAYLLRLGDDGRYTTETSKQITNTEAWVLNTELDVNDAILFIYSGGVQRLSTTNKKDYFTKCYGWNNNTKKLVDSTIGYYIPAEINLYDPITNYLASYIDDGNPCNWKGTECSIFDNILCIGDSITQGAPTPPNITPDPSKATRTVNNQLMYSYPASMKKQWGVECTNWGRSGIDTPDWYEYYSTNEPSWSGHDAAIMLIGNNDYHIADDMGGLTPENLETVSALSKAAMMNIITKLKADNADIKIFICTLLPGWDIGNSLSPYVVQNIRDIATDEDNVYLIDLSKYSIVKGSTPYMYGHPTALGYNQLAREIGGAIGYTIVNNHDDFMWIQFIGTEYAMDGQE